MHMYICNVILIMLYSSPSLWLSPASPLHHISHLLKSNFHFALKRPWIWTSKSFLPPPPYRVESTLLFLLSPPHQIPPFPPSWLPLSSPQA